MKVSHYVVLGTLAILMAAVIPCGAQDDAWDFVYNGDKLPQQIVDEGGTDWQPRSGETNGRPIYESIVQSDEAQVGGIWSRIDDNSADPDAPDASAWARGYLIGADTYSKFTGKLTLVLRIKDLGTDSQKSVIDFQSSTGDYWTLGHVAEDTDGPAGWEFGQTNDSRNANGLSDIRTGGNQEWVIIRINIVDTTPGDGKSRIRAWQDGILVYDAVRADDITALGEIAFRRTSGGSMQKMELDWVRMSFENAYAPGTGPETPNGDNDYPQWDFVYYGNELPQSIIDQGGTDWQARSGEIAGRPKYESIVISNEAQIGGLWERIDDNSDDPNAPDASAWARGYLFGSDVYDKWDGRMTLVLRIKEMGTTSVAKSVLDIQAVKDGTAYDYWTLGQVAADSSGPAGWIFGQTNDSRNANGLSDVRTDSSGKFVVIRITVQDDVPGDGQSLIRAWQDGVLVYESQRTDDISAGEFAEIAFRRTSGGNEQKMAIDWVQMKFGNVWEPGSGGQTPAGVMDGASANIVDLPPNGLVDGALGIDTLGSVRSVHGASQGAGVNPIFEVDANNVPTQLDIFYLGFDAMRDMETAANDKSVLTGVMALDKYGVIHTYSVEDPGETVSGPGVPSNPPRIDYSAEVARFNAENPSSPVILPFFGGFDASGSFQGLDLTQLGYSQYTGGDNGIARDIEVAIDWHSTTNAFQGIFMLDAFGGIFYFTNPEVLAYLNQSENNEVLTTRLQDSQGNPVVREPVGYQKFHDIFGFRPKYTEDYVGQNPSDDDKYSRAPAPYFYGFPVARDLEVMTRFDLITAADGTDLVTDSIARYQKAIADGIDADNLFQPIPMSSDRSNPNSPKFAPKVAVTEGYAILDAFGGVHTLVEDKDGNPIPAPWETVETGMMDPNANAPYFYNIDLAVDIEVFPNGNGFAVLTRLGEVYVVNGNGTTLADNFTLPSMIEDVPFFGFDAARDLTLVPNSEGKIAGLYVVDRFGTVHAAGQAPDLPGRILYFTNGYAQDLEISPYIHPITSAAQPVTSAD